MNRLIRFLFLPFLVVVTIRLFGILNYGLDLLLHGIWRESLLVLIVFPFIGFLLFIFSGSLGDRLIDKISILRDKHPRKLEKLGLSLVLILTTFLLIRFFGFIEDLLDLLPADKVSIAVIGTLATAYLLMFADALFLNSLRSKKRQK